MQWIQTLCHNGIVEWGYFVAGFGGAFLTFSAQLVQSLVSARNERRRYSGTVATSSADVLFSTSTSIINTLVSQNQALMVRIDTMIQRIDDVVTTMRDVAEKVHTITEQHAELMRVQDVQVRMLRDIKNGETS